MALIAIDNGHGQNTAGKRTPVFADGTKSPKTGKNFMHEWEFNYVTAKFLATELKRCGFATKMLSDTEADTPIGTRATTANAVKADFVVSIHANALDGKWGAQNGVETLTWNAGEGLRIGKLIQDELVKATGLKNRGMKDGSWLGILKQTSMPGALVECGFMDNLIEAKLLLSEAFRKKCAVAIAKGICAGFKVPYKADSPVVASSTPSKPAPAPSKPSTPPATTTMYRVVTGSYGVRENAEAQLAKLKKAGFDSFIDVIK